MKNKFYLIGKEVVQSEIIALKKLKKSINKDFDKIVDAILKCKGKVVFSGVGKSGIICKKISSTLSSWNFFVPCGCWLLFSWGFGSYKFWRCVNIN